MVAGTTQGADLPGDTVHSTVQLSTALAYSYKRNTVTIYGNVVAATQGATQQDVLGSGSASQAGQSFPLSRSPLTYLPAPTAAGAASTLVTSVNGVAWQEVDNLASADPADHVYMTQTDATGKTTVQFGDGAHGARLPTGAANVTAAYRVGSGVAGNAQPGQISQPQTRPQGVQGVINPLPASGGADPDTVETARANAPLAVLALDRVVSVQDYQDFARALAGIGKASSVLLSDGLSQFVHLTIGGTTDQPIETSSALVANLAAAWPPTATRICPCASPRARSRSSCWPPACTSNPATSGPTCRPRSGRPCCRRTPTTTGRSARPWCSATSSQPSRPCRAWTTPSCPG